MRADKGAPGVDPVPIAEIEAQEASASGSFIGQIQEQLRSKTYQPQPVRRVYMPKPNGKVRPLGNTNGARPCGADGNPADTGADFRG